MASITILKFNKYDKLFWQSKLGLSTQITIRKYHENNLNSIILNAEGQLLVDFYFAEKSESEEDRLVDIINLCCNSSKISSLFVMSPSFASEGIQITSLPSLEIVKSNFNIDFLRTVLTNINHQTQKAS